MHGAPGSVSWSSIARRSAAHGRRPAPSAHAGRVVAAEQVELDGHDVRVVDASSGARARAPKAGAVERADRSAGTCRAAPTTRWSRLARRRRSRGWPCPAGSSSAHRSGRRPATPAPRPRSRRPGRRPGRPPGSAAGTPARSRSSISSATSSRQPSMPKRSQCSATSSRYSRTCGLVDVELGQRRQAPPGSVAAARRQPADRPRGRRR